MVFYKSFPKKSDKRVYPQWEEIELSEEEEKKADEENREKNKQLMIESIEDAKEIIKKTGLKGYETTIARIASSLFDKRASHTVYLKEEKAREKFNSSSTNDEQGTN